MPLPLKHLYHQLHRLASGKQVVLWFLLSHAVLLCMMLFTFPKINARMGTEAFDLKPLGYSATEAAHMLGQLDPPTVRLYLFPQLFLFDVLYPLLLALFMSTFMIWLAKLTARENTPLVLGGIILPFIAMFFDYMENSCIAFMITDPENASPALIKAASTCTLLKGIFTSLGWIVILALLGSWGYTRVKNRRKQGSS